MQLVAFEAVFSGSGFSACDLRVYHRWITTYANKQRWSIDQRTCHWRWDKQQPLLEAAKADFPACAMSWLVWE